MYHEKIKSVKDRIVSFYRGYTCRKKIRIDSVKVPTIYQKEESKINPLKDTVRFVNLLMRMLILKK